jgi:tellurium resistance protein TerZ
MAAAPIVKNLSTRLLSNKSMELDAEKTGSASGGEMVMRTNDYARSQSCARPNVEPELKEIVMGLHWDPPEDGVTADPADLDALCVLFDAQGRVLEVIHPGHPRNADSSVVHTGDSRTGTSEWDDERIFVFLAALPMAVSSLTFVVVSATGRAFHEVRGAFCHVSDRVSEYIWVRLELTAVAGRSEYTVATLHRGVAGWSIATDVQTAQGNLLAELQSLVDRKRSGGT